MTQLTIPIRKKIIKRFMEAQASKPAVNQVNEKSTSSTIETTTQVLPPQKDKYQ